MTALAAGGRPVVYLAATALVSLGLIALSLASGRAAGVRLLPLALAALAVALGWPFLLGRANVRLARIARGVAFGAVAVAIVGVLIQLPTVFLSGVLPGLALGVVGAIWLATRNGLPEWRFLPGVRRPAGRLPRALPFGLAVGLVVLGAAGVSAALLLPLAVRMLVPLAAVVAALWRAGARPAPATVAAVASAGALFFIPFRSVGEVSLGGAEVGLSDVCLAVAALGWGLGVRQDAPRRVPAYALGVLAFTAWLAFTTVGAFSPEPVVKEVLKWLEIALAVTLLADVLRVERSRRWILWTVLLAVLAEAAIGLVQTLINVGPATFSVGGVIRAFGTFDQPNPYGGYLGLHAPFLLAAVIYAPRGRRGWLVVAWLLVLAAVVASRSRGAWLGLGVSTAVVLIAAGARTRLLARVLFVSAGALLAALVLAQALFDVAGTLPIDVRRAAEGRMRIEDTLVRTVGADYAVTERVAQWVTGWHMFVERPLTGVGAGNYDTAYPRYWLRPFQAPLGHAHNVYVTFAAEAGLLGLVGIVGLTVWALARAVGVVRRRRGHSFEWLAVGTLGGSAAFAAHNLVDSLFVSGMGVIFALFVALTYAVIRRARLFPRPPEVGAG
ncbi:MAG: O-antigen ligase family protein [Actinobacteria bacterium]|nr:O-antigen ligase family protein [Actinomycetota bacterium]